MYLIFGLIGGLSVAVAWFIPDSTMKVFLISALFAILLAMCSLIVSRGLSEKDSQSIREINNKLDNLLEKLDEDKPTITKICMPKPDISQLPHIIKEYEIVTQTQMHFNDLIMKVRTATLSVVLAVFGAAGYSFTAKEIAPFSYEGIGTVHPAAFIISSGIAILAAVFVVDYGYYYKMLIGAVKRGYEFDFGYDDIHQHDLWKVLGLPKDEILRLVIKTFDYELGFQPGAVDGVNALAKKHEVVLVTARPLQAKQKTLDWLKRNNISYRKIIFTNEGDKHCVEEENLEVIIDDHLEEISNWIGKTSKILVFNHPWNKSLNIKNHFKRVYSWENILEELN